jgi:UDP-GlcNAc:undecaprenyl-phosphate GlcNAc-1-phosphate transferase
MNFNPISFFIAFFITFILIPGVKRMAFTLKILDHPDQRKIHHHPIPLLGSIAVYLGLLAGLFFSGFNPFLQGCCHP